MIRIDEIWLATEPLDMRAGPDTALAGKTHENFHTARMSARYVSTSAAFFCFRRIPPLKVFSPFK